MESQKKSNFFKITFIIMLIPLIVGSIFSQYIEPSNRSDISVSVDFISNPVQRLDQLENGTIWVPYSNYAIEPSLSSEMVSGYGNLYAPDIIIENGNYLMWYGAQSNEGHDSIHFASSSDGRAWNKYGVVIPTGDNNHVNDPSVVKVSGLYYMYYTVAPIAELDQIWCATSPNGMNWTVKGAVLLADQQQFRWDSLKVGRPAVLYENGIFKMWFDGSQRSTSEPTKNQPGSGRHVGYATSTNGLNWTKWTTNPIFNNSGAIDVEKVDNQYVVVEESGNGVFWRVGTNETEFPSKNSYLFQKMNTNFDKYGHVTPFILTDGSGNWIATYTGAATKDTWNKNRIAIWYPCHNISMKTGGNLVRPWLSSTNRMYWNFPHSTVGTEFIIDYTQKNNIVGTNSELFRENGNYFLFSEEFSTLSSINVKENTKN
jgi:hypothetical protein